MAIERFADPETGLEFFRTDGDRPTKSEFSGVDRRLDDMANAALCRLYAAGLKREMKFARGFTIEPGGGGFLHRVGTVDPSLVVDVDVPKELRLGGSVIETIALLESRAESLR